jgi:formylglycine-generating enzyme required for sulfatase activity
MKRIFISVVMVALLALGGLAQAVNIETVFVGDRGNAADTTGYGSVAYNYNIGKYEVTAGQYTEFLNAVAAIDTYGLYNTNMASTSFGSGISRILNSSNQYEYTVSSSYVNRPVNYVSWGDTIRFVNWLQNGQKEGRQDASTTEDGTYFLNGATSIPQLITVTRKDGWTWALACQDEWYKAAYYKGGGTYAGYWLYPTSTNAVPGRDLTDASGNNANYSGNPRPIDSGNCTTLVGEFQESDSPYGTFDQGGNLWEWTDTTYAGNRVVRGGSWVYNIDCLESGRRGDYYQTAEMVDFGIRVVQVYTPAQAVPEPATLLGFGLPMLMIGLGKLRGLRK